MTIETTPLLTEAAARRLTAHIGDMLDRAANVLEGLAQAIREARDRRADLALGYASWGEYATAEFGPRTESLSVGIRRDLVAALGVPVDGSPALSSRQIAPAVGVSDRAVRKSLAQVGTEFPPDMARSPGEAAHPLDPTIGEVLVGEPTAARTIQGLDDKAYTIPSRPEPKLRRKSLPDRLKDKADDLFQAALDLHGAIEDDRFAANRESISFLTFNRSRAAAVALTDFIAALDPNAAVETEEARDRLAADLNHISETFADLAQSLTKEPK